MTSCNVSFPPLPVSEGAFSVNANRMANNIGSAITTFANLACDIDADAQGSGREIQTTLETAVGILNQVYGVSLLATTYNPPSGLEAGVQTLDGFDAPIDSPDPIETAAIPDLADPSARFPTAPSVGSAPRATAQPQTVTPTPDFSHRLELEPAPMLDPAPPTDALAAMRAAPEWAAGVMAEIDVDVQTPDYSGQFAFGLPANVSLTASPATGVQGDYPSRVQVSAAPTLTEEPTLAGAPQTDPAPGVTTPPSITSPEADWPDAPDLPDAPELGLAPGIGPLPAQAGKPSPPGRNDPVLDEAAYDNAYRLARAQAYQAEQQALFDNAPANGIGLPNAAYNGALVQIRQQRTQALQGAALEQSRQQAEHRRADKVWATEQELAFWLAFENADVVRWKEEHTVKIGLWVQQAEIQLRIYSQITETLLSQLSIMTDAEAKRIASILETNFQRIRVWETRNRATIDLWATSTQTRINTWATENSTAIDLWAKLNGTRIDVWAQDVSGQTNALQANTGLEQARTGTVLDSQRLGVDAWDRRAGHQLDRFGREITKQQAQVAQRVSQLSAEVDRVQSRITQVQLKLSKETERRAWIDMNQRTRLDYWSTTEDKVLVRWQTSQTVKLGNWAQKTAAQLSNWSQVAGVAINEFGALDSHQAQRAQSMLAVAGWQLEEWIKSNELTLSFWERPATTQTNLYQIGTQAEAARIGSHNEYQRLVVDRWAEELRQEIARYQAEANVEVSIKQAAAEILARRYSEETSRFGQTINQLNTRLESEAKRLGFLQAGNENRLEKASEEAKDAREIQKILVETSEKAVYALAGLQAERMKAWLSQVSMSLESGSKVQAQTYDGP